MSGHSTGSAWPARGRSDADFADYLIGGTNRQQAARRPPRSIAGCATHRDSGCSDASARPQEEKQHRQKNGRSHKGQQPPSISLHLLCRKRELRRVVTRGRHRWDARREPLLLQQQTGQEFGLPRGRRCRLGNRPPGDVFRQHVVTAMVAAQLVHGDRPVTLGAPHGLNLYPHGMMRRGSVV